MKIFFDKENNISFNYDDVNKDANDYKVVNAAEENEYDFGFYSPDDDDDTQIFDAETLAEIERMLAEGGGSSGVSDPDDEYDGAPDWGRNGFGRWHWDEGDLGDYDDTDAPPPVPKKEEKKKLTQEEVDSLMKKHCNHVWVKSFGLSRVYEDCKHCGIKKEDVK